MNGAIGVGEPTVGTATAVRRGVVDESVSPERSDVVRVLSDRSRPSVRDVPAAANASLGNAWVRPYLAKLLTADFLAAAAAAFVAYFIRFPSGGHTGSWSQSYVTVSLLMPFAWVLALCAADAYESRVFGLGADEFQRPFRAVVIMLALVGVASYALRLEVARGYVLIALPLTLTLTVLGRYAVRKQLHRRRSRGELSTAVVAVGDVESVVDLANRLHAEPYLGMRVVGACVPRHDLADQGALALMADAKVAPLGDLDSIAMAVSRSQADAVAVASTREMAPRRLRELSWELERSNVDLMVAPGLVEIAGPRLHIRPITGLPLLHIEKPEFSGVRRVVKNLFDRSAALFGLVVLSPLLIGVWFAVRLTSTGPAFFKQIRVGRDGQEFRIWKFRSMFVDAEARQAELARQNQHDREELFKMKLDPRITRVGRFIRRFSIDELPQLINVVNGTMSLVGPRPPLPSEVARYEYDARRRLLVRPGLTGLWQVSGRSDLSWEETVRLDLRYVENWSLGQDALILWKTVSAVAKGSGAY